MIHIIQNGILKAKCENCTCVFSFEPTDVWFTVEWDCPIPESYYHVDCPFCGERVDVSKVNPKFLERHKDSMKQGII